METGHSATVLDQNFASISTFKRRNTGPLRKIGQIFETHEEEPGVQISRVSRAVRRLSWLR